MKTQEAYKLFIEYGRAERGYARETLGKLRDCFSSWLLPAFHDRCVQDISRIDLMHFRSMMVERGVGANRQYSVLMCLKLFLKFRGLVLRIDCLDPHEIRLPSRPKPHVQYLKNAEISRIRDYFRHHVYGFENARPVRTSARYWHANLGSTGARPHANRAARG